MCPHFAVVTQYRVIRIPSVFGEYKLFSLDKIEPAASHGISHPSGEAGFLQALALALLSSIMYKQNMDRDKYQRDEQRVHLSVSHLIWCPRRRKPI